MLDKHTETQAPGDFKANPLGKTNSCPAICVLPQLIPTCTPHPLLPPSGETSKVSSLPTSLCYALTTKPCPLAHPSPPLRSRGIIANELQAELVETHKIKWRQLKYICMCEGGGGGGGGQSWNLMAQTEIQCACVCVCVCSSTWQWKWDQHLGKPKSRHVRAKQTSVRQD